MLYNRNLQLVLALALTALLVDPAMAFLPVQSSRSLPNTFSRNCEEACNKISHTTSTPLHALAVDYDTHTYSNVGNNKHQDFVIAELDERLRKEEAELSSLLASVAEIEEKDTTRSRPFSAKTLGKCGRAVLETFCKSDIVNCHM